MTCLQGPANPLKPYCVENSETYFLQNSEKQDLETDDWPTRHPMWLQRPLILNSCQDSKFPPSMIALHYTEYFR